MRSNGHPQVQARLLERHNEDVDGTIRAHNTLSTETTQVQVFYPFHPLHGVSLQVIRRPKRGDGAVSVLDVAGKRLKIPLWMLFPESAGIKTSDQAHLSKESLLSLASLLSPLLDNLVQTFGEKCKGGGRAANATEAERNKALARADRQHPKRR
jgi:hypothetical protein